MAKGIVVCSGGMDSVTLAHMLAEHDDLHLVSFTYGQKHEKELSYAANCASQLGAKWSLVDIAQYGELISQASSLTNPDEEVPDGHYAEENMRSTVVPNRNMTMLSMAVGIAVAEEADYVATGVHAGDHFVYPDCRPEFITDLLRTVLIGNEGFIKAHFTLETPFVLMMKHDIVKVGIGLDAPVDYTQTWSCYKGGDIHCGTCGTCTERKEAFQLAEFEDPTEYAA